jgi:zinc protease
MTRLRERLGAGIERYRLSNGLSLLVRQDASVPLVALRCYVRGGSVAEWPRGGRGIAHLLEHVVATAVAEEMERAGDGALANAFTGRDYTCFHWSVLREDAASSLRHFFAGLRQASDRAGLASGLEPQRQVVLEEIDLFRAKRVAAFQQDLVEQVFEVHPVRYPVCGHAPLLRQVAAGDLAEYLRRFYVGQNMRLVAVGDFESDEVVDAVEETCGGLDEGSRFDLDGEVREPPRPGIRRFAIEAADVEDGYTQIGLRAAGAGSLDALAFELLAQEVNSRRGALRQALLAADLAFDVGARHLQSVFGAGCFSLLAHHPPEREEAVAAALQSWLVDLAEARTPLALDAVEREGDALAGEPTFDGWAALLGHGDACTGDPLAVSSRREGLCGIGEEEVRQAVARSLEAGLTIGWLGPRSRPAPARRTTGPEPFSARLASGLRLLVLPSPNPLAACQVLGIGGPLAEDGETNGVCSLMARLLPACLPSEEERRELAGYRTASGADFFAFCDESSFGVSLSVAERDLRAGLGLLASMVVRPAFTDELVEPERDGTAAWLRKMALQWQPDVQARLKRLLFAGHPYGMQEIGRPDSLARLVTADVAACHARVCVGGNLAVVVTGRVPPPETGERLAELFAAVPAGELAMAGSVKIAEPRGTRPRVSAETHPRGHGALALGFSGVAWEAESWWALEMLKSLLVGPQSDVVTGRLIKSLRAQGTAYSVSVVNQPGPGEGYFAVLAAFAPEREEQVIAVIERELERLREGAVAPRELDHCRKLYLLHHLRQYESPRQQAYNAGRFLLFSPPEGDWGRWTEQLLDLTLDDVVAVARRVFRGEARGLVVLRPEAELDATRMQR